jgi:hypothetical protein
MDKAFIMIKIGAFCSGKLTYLTIYVPYYTTFSGLAVSRITIAGIRMFSISPHLAG